MVTVSLLWLRCHCCGLGVFAMVAVSLGPSVIVVVEVSLLWLRCLCYGCGVIAVVEVSLLWLRCHCFS